jgi:hypothetical protein
MSEELLMVMPRAGRDSWGTLLPSRNNPEKQFCGSWIVYSGSGSRFAIRKVSYPVPDSDNLIFFISFLDFSGSGIWDRKISRDRIRIQGRTY